MPRKRSARRFLGGDDSTRPCAFAQPALSGALMGAYWPRHARCQRHRRMGSPRTLGLLSPSLSCVESIPGLTSGACVCVCVCARAGRTRGGRADL
jgi:hypothetical protein